jgi:molybdopterin-guanine dinucleotide biosynthesis protein A
LKVCLPHIEQRLREGALKVIGFFDAVRVACLSEADIDRIDPGRLSFFNVDTQEDMDRARELAATEM